MVAGEPGAPPKISNGLSPAQLMAAYDTGPLLSRGITGKGQTIAIVIPLGSPSIRHDLAAYDKAWHLPAPPSLRIITPEGPVPAVPAGRRADHHRARDHHGCRGGASDGARRGPPAGGSTFVWAYRTGSAAGFVDAVVYVIRHHLASVISLSLGGRETSFPLLRPSHRAVLRAASRASSPVTIVAATGDYGAAELKPDGTPYRTPQVSWPASDPLVVAVGGTKLELGEQPPGDPVAPATSWPHSNGGRSTVFARPSFQSTVAGVAGRWRALPDVSMDASEGTGMEMYTSPHSSGASPGHSWGTGFGASLATPLFAGVVALADQAAGRPLGLINPLLYRLAAQHDPGIVDVQGQGNTFHTGHITVRGFPAGPGYDLVTGLGTIDAAKLIPDLVRLARQGTS